MKPPTKIGETILESLGMASKKQSIRGTNDKLEALRIELDKMNRAGVEERALSLGIEINSKLSKADIVNRIVIASRDKA